MPPHFPRETHFSSITGGQAFCTGLLNCASLGDSRAGSGELRPRWCCQLPDHTLRGTVLQHCVPLGWDKARGSLFHRDLYPSGHLCLLCFQSLLVRHIKTARHTGKKTGRSGWLLLGIDVADNSDYFCLVHFPSFLLFYYLDSPLPNPSTRD